jgi:hypothetical protein
VSHEPPPLDAGAVRGEPIHWLVTFKDHSGRMRNYLACGHDDMASPWDDEGSEVTCQECMYELELKWAKHHMDDEAFFADFMERPSVE